MTTLKLTHDEIAARFGCTVEQVKAQHRRNADSTLADLRKAEATGKKVCGMSADQLRAQYTKLCALAK